MNQWPIRYFDLKAIFVTVINSWKPPFLDLLANMTETDIRRVIHYGILLSRQSRLHWNTLNGSSVLSEIYQRFHNTTIRPKSPNECRRKCEMISSLKCTDRFVTFASCDDEFSTLCAFMRNGSVTNKLEALFCSKNVTVLKKYFRSCQCTPLHKEKCICVPDIYLKLLQSGIEDREEN